MLKIALVHTRYRQLGGEDQAFSNECALLRSRGHHVLEFTDDNQRILDMPLWTAAAGTIWSSDSRRRLLDFLRVHRADVVHFHNTFPLISPAAYSAAREAKVPVVQTLHNFRVLCPKADFLRNSVPCESCLGRSFPFPGVWYRCYHNSTPASLAVAAMIGTHRLLRTWQRNVDVYVALSEFARRKFVEGGLPAAKIVVKPSFVRCDPGSRSANEGFALYVGRLSEEKGVTVLLDAWKQLGAAMPLKIAGDGSLQPAPDLRTSYSGVEWLGRLANEEIILLMKRASVLICPSICYENFPVVIAEAFAAGLPVIASARGSMAEIVRDGVTGRLFAPGDATALADAVRWFAANSSHASKMGEAARTEFERRFTAEQAYRSLMRIYSLACSRSGNVPVLQVGGSD